MLAELAAANAAFAVIKKAVSNGKEIADCASAISKFVNAKEDLQKKGNRRKNSLFNSQKADDLEEFMALEKIRQQEEELKQYMIYAGRPGLWNDWVRFQGQARVKRQQDKEARKKRIAFIGELALIVILIALFSAIVVFFVWLGLEHSRRAG